MKTIVRKKITFQNLFHPNEVLYKISECKVNEYKLQSNNKKEQKICKTLDKLQQSKCNIQEKIVKAS